MNSRLMWVSESKGLLASEHFDITKTRSIRNHLVRFDSYIRNDLQKKKEKKKKTLLPISLIWKKLMTPRGNTVYYMISKPSTVIDGFLPNRPFQLRTGSALSDALEQEMGVLQCNILCPVLFSIINDILKLVLKS